MKYSHTFYKNIFYGFIVGDALGVPVEFKPRDSFNVKTMTGYGTYNQPKGTWSDDSSLMLCTIENISEDRTLYELMLKFKSYVEQGYLTPYGKCFDIGKTTYDAIKRFSNGEQENCWGSISISSNGNGALMRMTPLIIPLSDESSVNNRIHMVTEYTKVTHAHPRSILASVIYVEFILTLINSVSIDLDNLPKMFISIMNSISKRILKDLPDNHYFFKEFVYFEELFEDEFYTYDRLAIPSSGYVVDTWVATFWCVGTTKSYKEAVLRAVNLGNDTDTIAALTGSIASIVYNEIPSKNIPKIWINELANKELIDKIISKIP